MPGDSAGDSATSSRRIAAVRAEPPDETQGNFHHPRQLEFGEQSMERSGARARSPDWIAAYGALGNCRCVRARVSYQDGAVLFERSEGSSRSASSVHDRRRICAEPLHRWAAPHQGPGHLYDACGISVAMAVQKPSGLPYALISI